MKKSNRIKPIDIELSYSEEFEKYRKVLEVASLISLNQHGIHANGRGVRAVKIFTRQTLTALSLSRILPRPNNGQISGHDLWDVISVASLSRNLLEGYLSLYYFGLEKITESEAELRFFILQLHKNVEWYNIRKLSDPSDSELTEFESGIAEQKLRIKNHPFLNELSDSNKRRALQGIEMYKTKADFEEELDICKDLKRDYRHLSNLIHPLPLSIERIDNTSGRGLPSLTDISYIIICLMIARKYLAASTIGIADYFPVELAEKFKNEVNSIRPFENSGFDT